MKPQRLEDDILGTLTWDEAFNWYKTIVEFGGESTVMFLLETGNLTPDEALSRARVMFQSLRVNEPSLRAITAEQLLDTANEWNDDRDEPHPPLDVAAFSTRVTPESRVFHEDGNADIFYNDGDIFWGHVMSRAWTKAARFPKQLSRAD